MEKRTVDILSTILSIVVGVLFTLSLLLFFLSSRNVISKPDCQFLVKAILSLAAFLAGLFSVATKKAPYRGGLADKSENAGEYYIMTTIWFAVCIYFAIMAFRR